MTCHSLMILKYYVNNFEDPQYDVVKALLEPALQHKITKQNWMSELKLLFAVKTETVLENLSK